MARSFFAKLRQAGARGVGADCFYVGLSEK